MLYQFGSFHLDVSERRLLCEGQPRPLRTKVFDTLVLLVENHGKLLRKEELMRRLWPDRIVEENNLDHNISALRRALEEGKDGMRYIETVPRQGYRFVAEVRALLAAPERSPSASEPDDDDEAGQEIRFFTASDGVKIAYSVGGSGPVLVRAGQWINHLGFEWKSPQVRRWLQEIMRHHTLVRYDQRGTGLSDWNVQDISFPRAVLDFEELIVHLGIERFAFYGSCQGGAIATRYAVRHPDKVTALVLMGAFARGWPSPDWPFVEHFQSLLALIRTAWGYDNPALRQLWTTLFMPDAGVAEMAWMNEMQRVTSSPENAARLMSEFPEANVLDVLPSVACPTLIMHSRDDAVVPVQEGRLLAARIPGARFVELASRSHQVRPGEPAFQDLVREVGAFLGWPLAAAAAQPRT